MATPVQPIRATAFGTDPPADPRTVFDVVGALRTHSLVTARTDGDVRLLGLFGLVRLFLAERLAEWHTRLNGERFGRDQVRRLIEQINEAVGDGARLRVA